MMNTNEVAIRCGEHAFTRLQKLLPQQDRLLPKIYQNEDQYIIYWESIHWFESSDKREAELVRAFNRAFDYLEECPFDQDGNICRLSEPMLFHADGVIIAVSQGPKNKIVSTTSGLQTTEHGLLFTDVHGNTTRPGIFASGDVVLGARTVVEAVKYSKEVAQVMDEYLSSIQD